MSAPSASPLQPRARRLARAFLAGFALLALSALILGGLYLRNNRAPNLTIPTPALPAENAYDDFVHAGKMARGMKHLTPANMPGPPEQTRTFANYKAAALDFAPALAVIHSALDKPCQTPPVRTILPATWSNQALFRNLARNLSGAGRYEQLAGHSLRAADTWLDGVEMSAMVEHGGGFVDSLTARACQSACLAHFEELLGQLNGGELRHVADRMTQIQKKQVACGDLLLEEGYTSVAGLLDSLRFDKEKHQATPLQIARSLIQSDSDKMPTREEATQIAQYVFSSKERMLEQILDYYRAVAQESQQPYIGKSHIAVPNNIYGNLLITDVNAFREKYCYYEAVFTILRMEVALHRHRLAHGRFPSTLESLAPTYLPTLPDDPFGGARNRPLHYKVTPNGESFVLYSVGLNRTDDNAVPDANHAARHSGDIVSGFLFSKSN